MFCVPLLDICRKVCSRSVSIPPILEGDTDNWEQDEPDSIELDSEKKQSRKRYRSQPSQCLI